MTLRNRLHLASLALAAASLAAAGAMMPNPATAAEPTCLGRTVTINLNVEGHPPTNSPDGDVILGTPGEDIIDSGGGPDTICAGAGDDNVNAGGENDTVDGGTGDDMLFGGDNDSDTLVYLTRTVPVVASVQGTAKVGASEEDTITDFETIFGGHKDDTLTGDDEANFFIGGDGNDTLNGEGGDDDFIGDDFVTTGIFGNGATGNGADTINGGSGNDTVDYGSDHASSVAVTLSVTGASGNNTDGDAGSRDTLKGVEDVHGTKGNDRITGNILANHLYGWSSGGSAGSGNDVLDGGPGDAADVLDGGDGTDTVSYASHTKGVQVDMVADQDNEGDEFSHVSHVIGSKFNDLVRDDSHRAIVLDGGAGVDTLDMGAHTDGVTVSFDGKANDGNDEDEGESGVVGKRDLVTNFENVIGTTGDDKLTGDAKANKLEGGAGNDKLYGLDGSDQLNGGFGADTLSGGDGVDTALYTDRTDPNDSLVITLDGGANDGSAVNDDTVSSGGAAHDNVGTTIENVRSGAGNDTITGSSAANVLYGGGGDDTLSGGDGNDTLRGDAGADIFSGGGGADTVTYTDRTTSTSGIVVTIGSGTANDGSSTDASVDPASTARDDVRGSVENVIGGAGGDSLTGSSAANRLTGGTGVDKLYGLGGNDALSAKDGVKDGRIDGGTGTDTASRDSIDPSPISVP